MNDGEEKGGSGNERGRGRNGKEGRTGESEISDGKAPQGDSGGRCAGALGREGGGGRGEEMTLEERMARMEADYGNQSDLIQELRDAVTVTAQLEARQGGVLTEHGDWLASHDAAMKQHDEAMKQHDEAIKKLDERIVGLVSGVGEFMRRGNPRA